MRNGCDTKVERINKIEGYYARLIRDIKCALTEKSKRSSDEEELLQVLKQI